MMTRLQRWLLAVGIILALPACAGKQIEIPKEIPIPIPVPCEIEQVPLSELPVAEPGANVARKAQVAAARIRLLEADRARLAAANNNPCPTEISE